MKIILWGAVAIFLIPIIVSISIPPPSKHIAHQNSLTDSSKEPTLTYHRDDKNGAIECNMVTAPPKDEGWSRAISLKGRKIRWADSPKVEKLYYSRRRDEWKIHPGGVVKASAVRFRSETSRPIKVEYCFFPAD